MNPRPADQRPDVAELLASLAAGGATVATAESLTGGLVCAALTDVAGSSTVVRGGVVAYATGAKAAMLGVPADLLAAVGPVSEPVALAMAAGARDGFRATYGVATTGVAGPDPQDGHAVGEVFVAVAGPGAQLARRLALSGDRAAIRAASVTAALALLAELADRAGPAGPAAGTAAGGESSG